MKLCRNVHYINLYNNVFYCRCSCTFIAMATYSFHLLIMGKVKIGIYCYLIADILTKVSQKVSLGGPLQNISFLSKCLKFIGCHGNRKAQFVIFFFLIFSEAIRGIKLKLCSNVHNISLYKTGIFYCHCSCNCYGNSTFSIDLNGKSKNWLLLLSHCRYFDKKFTEMYRE